MPSLVSAASEPGLDTDKIKLSVELPYATRIGLNGGMEGDLDPG